MREQEKNQEKILPDFDLPAQETDPKLTEAVRSALSDINPDEEAKTRMYQNILRKAAAQGAPVAASHAPANKKAQSPSPVGEFDEIKKQEEAPDADLAQIRRKKKHSWRSYLSLAACLLLVITAGVSLPKWLDSGDGNLPGSSPGSDAELQDPPTLTASPYEDVKKPEDFAQLGFVIDAPADASDITYSIAYGTTAQVEFTMADHHYTYLAEKRTEDISDISGIYGDVQESQTLTVKDASGTEMTVTLEKIQISEAGTEGGDSDNSAAIWRASWQNAGVSYCLLNEDGAEESAMTAGVQALAAKM